MSQSGMTGALSLCRRAGKLVCGYDAAVGAVQAGAPLAIVFHGASERTRRVFRRECEGYCECVDLPPGGEQLERVLGKSYAVAAVTDPQLANLLKANIEEAQQ